MDANGAPLVGGKIFTYLAGTTTPAATYTTNAGSVQQANPIILNSRGCPDNPIWLGAGVAMKLVVSDANSVVLPPTYDNVLGVNDPSGITAQDQWVTYSGTAIFLSATSFSVAGDQTGTLQVGRRVRTTNSGGTVYSTVSSATFAAGVTTVVIVNDSGTLDAGLSQVSYGILSATNPSIPYQAAEVQLASGGTCDIGAAVSPYIQITGTTAITSFGTNFRGPKFIRFAGALTLTNSGSLILPGGQNITTAAGDTCTVVPVSGGWAVSQYQFATLQTIQDVTGSRVLGTTYTNSTNRTIYVTIAIQTTSASASTLSATIGAVSGILGSTASSTNFASSLSFAVPPGQSYSAIATGGPATLSKWTELR